MSRLRKSFTFSNVIAMVALFLALGGSVYAASNKIDGSQIKAKSLPANRLVPGSVAAAQIKKGSVGGPQLKAGAVSAQQIRSGSITGAQIKAGSISGTQIQSGSLGATQINQTTLTGISAASLHTVQYVTTTVTLAVESETGSSGTASCPSGMKVVGGGATTSNSRFASVFESAPNSTGSGWFANGFSGEPGVSMTITAICTPVG